MDCAVRTERGQLPKLSLLILVTPRWWWENSSRISASKMVCMSCGSLGFLAMSFRWVVLSFSVGGDLPDKVSTRVCDEGIAAVVDGDVTGGIDLFGGEGGEEEAAAGAGAEVVGSEGVERRDPRRKCCGGDGMCGILV